MTQWIPIGLSTKIVVGPFVTPTTDGLQLTPVTDAVASDMDVFEVLKHGASDVSALDSDDAFVAINGMDGYYNLTLTTDLTNTAGNLRVAIQDTSRFLPVKEQLLVVPVNTWGGFNTATDNFQAHAVEFSVAANNPQASDTWAFATRELTSGANLNDIAASDVWDAQSSDFVVAGTFGTIADSNGDVTSILPASDINAIADQVWNEATTDHVAAGSFGLNLDAQVSTRSSHDAAGAADAVWDELASDHTTAGSYGAMADSNAEVNAGFTSSDVWAFATRTLTSGANLNDIAVSDVWDALSSDYVVAGSFGTMADSNGDVTANLPASDINAIADQVWNEATTDHVAAGSFGLNLDAQVSTRSSHAASDVTAQTAASDVWDVASSDFTGAGTFGLYLDAQISALNDLAASDIQAELVTYAGLKSTDGAWVSDIAALNDLAASDINAEVVDVMRTDTIPDSINADGSAPTIAQALYGIYQILSERTVAGTDVTIAKLDGTTTLMTFGLDSDTNPTSITRIG